MVDSNWFYCPKPRPGAKIRLFCFPHAGGAAAVFREWPESLPEWIDVWAVQSPGRGWRVREPAYTDLSKLVEDACDVLRPHLAQPFAFFGHSMGAVVAFEAARRLAREGTEPVALFLSGRRAPGIPDSEPSLEHLSDADFVEAIDARFGGIPDVIRDSSELMELLLPTLRADVTALVNYHYQKGDRLGSAIYAFGGIDDLTVSEQEMSVWREVTHGPFLSRMFRGGHFFIESSRSEVLAFMAAELDSLSKSSDSEVSDG